MPHLYKSDIIIECDEVNDGLSANDSTHQSDYFARVVQQQSVSMLSCWFKKKTKFIPRKNLPHFSITRYKDCKDCVAISTGASLYLANKTCYFLSARLPYKPQLQSSPPTSAMEQRRELAKDVGQIK
jgi:hypothetical protein